MWRELQEPWTVIVMCIAKLQWGEWRRQYYLLLSLTAAEFWSYKKQKGVILASSPPHCSPLQSCTTSRIHTLSSTLGSGLLLQGKIHYYSLTLKISVFEWSLKDILVETWGCKKGLSQCPLSLESEIFITLCHLSKAVTKHNKRALPLTFRKEDRKASRDTRYFYTERTFIRDLGIPHFPFLVIEQLLGTMEKLGHYE